MKGLNFPPSQRPDAERVELLLTQIGVVLLPHHSYLSNVGPFLHSTFEFDPFFTSIQENLLKDQHGDPIKLNSKNLLRAERPRIRTTFCSAFASSNAVYLTQNSDSLVAAANCWGFTSDDLLTSLSSPILYYKWNIYVVVLEGISKVTPKLTELVIPSLGGGNKLDAQIKEPCWRGAGQCMGRSFHDYLTCISMDLKQFLNLNPWDDEPDFEETTYDKQLE